MSLESIDPSYLSEINEVAESCENLLMKLEKGFDENVLKDLMRNFHSLKGTCGMLGIDELEIFFHHVESFFIHSKGNYREACEKLLQKWSNVYEYFDTGDGTLLNQVTLLTVYEEQRDKATAQNMIKKDSNAPKLSCKNISAVLLVDDAEKSTFSKILHQIEEFKLSTSIMTSMLDFKNLIYTGKSPNVVFVSDNFDGQPCSKHVQSIRIMLPDISVVIIDKNLTKDEFVKLMRNQLFGYISIDYSVFDLERLLLRLAKEHAKHSLIKKSLLLSHELLKNDTPELKEKLNHTLKLLEDLKEVRRLSF